MTASFFILDFKIFLASEERVLPFPLSIKRVDAQLVIGIVSMRLAVVRAEGIFSRQNISKCDQRVFV